MPIAAGVAVVGAAATLGAGYMNSQAAKKAADTQSKAAQNIANQQIQVNQQAFSPWMGQGQQAYQTLGQLYGVGGAGPNGQTGMTQEGINQGWSQFLNTPAYQFAVQQGNLGLDRTAASKGLLLSGGQLKDAMQFNQGLGAQQVGNYTNVLQSMSDLGLRASAGYAGQFNQAANTMMGGANAQAAGTIGSANAWSQGLTGAGNNLLSAYGLSKFGSNSTTNYNPSSYQWTAQDTALNSSLFPSYGTSMGGG